jgi:Na+/melibiose symporter-like transporter
MKAMSVRRFRTAAAVVWVAGIAGMIVNSIRGNNNGWVVTSGMATAIASIVVLAVTNATQHARVDVFEEADAERLDGGPDARARCHARRRPPPIVRPSP